MTLPELDRGASPPPSPNRLDGSEEPGPTVSYSPSEDPPPAGAPSSGTRRFDFLGQPRAEGELGWLAHYRVKRLIGEGGIGLVFLAEDTHLARPVALKVIRPEQANAPEVRGRFVREAQATAAIKHDHIVTIYQVGRDHDVLFLAMEYLQGLSLQGWLERGRKPSTDLVLRIGREIASGLAAAHRVGLIHRDIKPANIWLESPSGRVKILDFGMARSERDDKQITHAGTVMGTPAFMAPEQARGEVAAAASDLFSLGCILYRLCAGMPPFEGPTILAVLSALASETPRSLREKNPAVIPALDELVMRLLAKDPSGRPATAQAVVESIRAIERELLADRQKVELSDDSTRQGAEILPTLLAAGVEADRVEARPGPRTGRSAWRIAAVVGAAASVGVFVNVRPRPTFHVAASRPVALPSALAAPSVGMAPAKESGTSSAHRQIEPDRANPEVVRATVEGNDSPPPGVPPAPRAPIEKDQDAGRDNMSKSLDDGRPEGPDRLRGEDRLVSAMPIRNDWGKPIDPDSDCKFEIDEDNHRIKIAIPGTPHVLSAELGRRNAPRLLRPAGGDFDVSVSVDGVFHPSGRATTKEYAPYHGAGILVWQDERNYVRLEIATDIHRGKVRSYANFELRKVGALAVSRGLEIKDGSTHLRLERRGSEVRAAFGPDGVRWTRFEPLLVDFDDRLSVGLVAINSATKPLNAGLEMFSITRRNKAGDKGFEVDDKSPPPEPRPSP
jgi:serine/threonine protein kinase/regulation of enolase protein 1 (concanavalin A-like superfamily)